MSKMSLIDKLGVLLDLSSKSTSYLIVLVVLLIFGIILSFTNKKNEKANKVLYAIMTITIIGLLIATYHSSLGNMFSYMMNNFFIAVYFPTIAIYLAAIIAMNIIVFVSIFSYKSSKQIRVLNISIYIIMNYLMALLLKVINTNKLDIFDQASLYGNKEATALIELSSIVFMVWIIFLVLYKVILIYIRKDYKPKVKRIIVRKKVKKLPENFEPKKVPDYVYGKLPHKETLVIDTSEKSEDEILLERFSKQFTLDDYKLFSRLLKEEQDRKNNPKDYVKIDFTDKIVKKEMPKQVKENNSKIEFINIENHEKVSRPKKHKEIVISSANALEEDDYREQQKQEIIRMEEERRELLRQEQEKQRIKEEQRLLEEQRIAAEEKIREEQRIAEEQRLAEEEKIREEQELEEKILQEEKRRQEEKERLIAKQKKEARALELLLQRQKEEERELKKLTELEMLYR